MIRRERLFAEVDGSLVVFLIGMPPFALGKVGTLSTAAGGLHSAEARLRASGTQP